ncbi:MAG: tRNA (adenosine(37)-N6)-threonylcarbamoyltransferase complex transferase subunit TsaD [Reyranellaceae bacterium]
MAHIVLGLETSCDETAAALVDGDRRILAERLLSQVGEHRPFGGVVPEIAARAHLDHLDRLIGETMAEAGLGFADLAAVAATAGPGLIGGVIVGVTTAKAIALAHGLPFIGVNHLEGHALTARLTDDVAFPYLLLLVSGGHCQLLAVEGVGRYRRLGTTIDDAVGEAFDKTAKLLGLGFPGGPAVEQAALKGHAGRFPLPRPMLGRPGCDFSLAGLKTAVRLAAEKLGEPSAQDVADLCAAFQLAVGDVLVDRCRNALAAFAQAHPGPVRLVVAGGVAANRYLRDRLQELVRQAEAELIAPPPRLCTDNAAMIAWAGLERLRLGQVDALDLAPRPRWPLDPAAAARIGRPGRGAGVKV